MPAFLAAIGRLAASGAARATASRAASAGASSAGASAASAGASGGGSSLLRTAGQQAIVRSAMSTGHGVSATQFPTPDSTQSSEYYSNDSARWNG